MGKLTENAWIDGVGYGPGFGDRQPPGHDDTDAVSPVDPELEALAGLSADDLAALAVLAEGAAELTPVVLAAQLAQVPDDKTALAEFADRHGIEVDNRLGAVKMRAAIVEAIEAS